MKFMHSFFHDTVSMNCLRPSILGYVYNQHAVPHSRATEEESDRYTHPVLMKLLEYRGGWILRNYLGQGALIGQEKYKHSSILGS